MTDATTTFRSPSDDLVDRAVMRLSTLQLRRAFFEGLKNPLWVAPLRDRGMFSNPPATVFSDDGYARTDPWPELDYLLRVTADVPDDVSSVLVKVTSIENAWIRRGIVEAASKLPPGQADMFAPAMIDWTKDRSFSGLIDANQVVAVISNLCSAALPSGMKLAEAYYRPRANPQASDSRLPEPSVAVEDYWYQMTLPTVASALGDDAITKLKYWLEDYQKHSKSFRAAVGEDSSTIWRPRVSGSQQFGSHEVGDALIDALVDQALQRSEDKQQQDLVLLHASEQPLLSRIALHVATQQLERVPAGVKDPIGDGVADLLADPKLLNFSYRLEYFEFAKAVKNTYPEAFDQAFGAVFGLASAEFERTRREDLELAALEGVNVEERATSYVDRWQHGLLSGVGADTVPEALMPRLRELNAARGEIERPDRPAFEITSGSGFSSPMSAAEMNDLSDEDLLAQLSTWHPAPSGWDEPSHLGQKNELTEAIAQSPGRMVDKLAEISELRPIYVRGILEGWQKSVDAGTVLKWDELIGVLAWAVERDDAEVFTAEGDLFEDDQTYRHLKFQVGQLISSIISWNAEDDQQMSPDDLCQLQSILEVLAKSPDPEPRTAHSVDDESDPLTLSLNSTRPVAIRGLTRLLAAGLSETQQKRTLDFLHQRSEADSSLATAAAFGESFWRLSSVAPEWTAARTSSWFGTSLPTSDWQQVALSTAIARHNYHPKLLDLFRPALMAYLTDSDHSDLKAGWRTVRSFDQLVGDWIVSAFVVGQMDVNDSLFTSFFGNSTAETRRDVLGHLGWSAMHWVEPDPTVLSRTRELWDLRAASADANPDNAIEFDEFYWYIRSGQFEAGWWLPRLIDLVKSGRSLKSRGMIGEQLATAAHAYPEDALTALEFLLKSQTDQVHLMSYDLVEYAAAPVIAMATTSGDDEVARRASDLMNWLGSVGFQDMEKRVNDRLHNHSVFDRHLEDRGEVSSQI
jgi:hypothetical protein